MGLQRVQISTYEGSDTVQPITVLSKEEKFHPIGRVSSHSNYDYDFKKYI